MKRILLALAVIGLTFTGASAQSSANSKFAKNYPVCLIDGKYQICNSGVKQDIGRTTEVSAETFVEMETTTVHMGQRTNTGNTINRGRIRVTYDNMNDPYNGNPAMQYDGPADNKQRNIRYLNTSHPIPPNDGGVSNP